MQVHRLTAADLQRQYPRLGSAVSERWLADQAALPPWNRAPLLDWLRLDARTTSTFLDELESNLVTLAHVHGLRERVHRLRGPMPEFWAALCELKAAAALAAAGLTVTFQADTPDVRAYSDSGPVGLELTAKLPTMRFSNLRTAIVDVWEHPGRLILFCRDETAQFLTTHRDALIDLISTVEYDSLPEPVVDAEDLLDDEEYLHGDEVFELVERRLPTDAIVDPAALEVYLGPAPFPVVVTRSGVRSALPDAWPILYEAAREKARKMPSGEVGIIGIEGGLLDWGALIWADLVEAGHLPVELRLPAHIAGVLVYWQDATRTAPSISVFIWNGEFKGDRTGAVAVLAALNTAV
jgi:hypothetical protein